MSVIRTEPLTAAAFEPFGDVLECSGDADMLINQGLCSRFHDQADLEFTDGRAGISLFRSETRTLPYRLEMVERHPLGSQAFISMSLTPFLVIAAEDSNAGPQRPRAFVSEPGQAINFHRDTWHGVLTPLHEPGLFAVIDRISDTSQTNQNLEEFWFPTPYTVTHTPKDPDWRASKAR
ncbi:MAG: ureidoglycolate lyase [Pseudomonadota bacterium]